MLTSSQGCKWDRGMGLLPDLTQGPTASPAQTPSKCLTLREKRHHSQVPEPQNSAAIKANSLKATKLPAPWHRPPAPAGIWGQQEEHRRRNTRLPLTPQKSSMGGPGLLWKAHGLKQEEQAHSTSQQPSSGQDCDHTAPACLQHISHREETQTWLRGVRFRQRGSDRAAESP